MSSDALNCYNFLALHGFEGLVVSVGIDFVYLVDVSVFVSLVLAGTMSLCYLQILNLPLMLLSLVLAHRVHHWHLHRSLDIMMGIGHVSSHSGCSGEGRGLSFEHAYLLLDLVLGQR